MDDILALIGDRCDGVIGQASIIMLYKYLFAASSIGITSICICDMQLTEDWGEVLFSALKRAGGTAISNMAVGYNNVDVSAANKYGVAIGNTPVSSPMMIIYRYFRRIKLELLWDSKFSL